VLKRSVAPSKSSIALCHQTSNSPKCKDRSQEINVDLCTEIPRSTRRAAAANRIRGPQSALTDFLASHNISAQQIHLDHQHRLQNARDQEALYAANAENEENESEEVDEDVAERQKRKRKEEKALLKMKQSKEFKRRKLREGLQSDDDEDDDFIARDMLKQKSKPLPGQLENCDICAKRFTVTPYCKTGPNGGLLCTKCSKELKDEEKKDAAAKKKKSAAPRGRRRQTESDRLMGDVKPGVKSLVDICVRRVANVINDIDDFGDMPEELLDRLSQILSKQRVLTPRVLQLFLRRDLDRISIYDCGKLETEDFKKIFAFMPDIRFVNLRFAGQLKDDTIYYMTDKCKMIRHLQLGATNLVSDKAWIELFQAIGPNLESLKLSELNDSLRHVAFSELIKNCQNLNRLKLRSCSHVDEGSISLLSQLKNLEHLTLGVAQHETSSATLVDLITTLGPKLRTLCLEEFQELDDAVLIAIANNCNRLSKLRIRGSSIATDAAFAELFGHNSPIPSLTYVDLSDNRDVDNMAPDGPEEAPIGVADLTLPALMQHSGSTLRTLNLKADRHISHSALLSVFDGKEKYPALKDMDLSFVTQVDDVVMQGIFRSCPELAKLAAFACFNARSAAIPVGIAVIGLPNAQDSIIIGGDAIGEP